MLHLRISIVVLTVYRAIWCYINCVLLSKALLTHRDAPLCPLKQSGSMKIARSYNTGGQLMLHGADCIRQCAHASE
jgi:hypothetical protein